MSTASGHSHDQTIPPYAVAAAGVLVATTLAMTALVRFGVLDREAVPATVRSAAHVAPAETRELIFADRADGAVVVRDAATGATVEVLIDGIPGNGFVRGVMRGMARERRSHGIGMAPPFELTLWRNNTLTLTDKSTGRSIEMGSFGADNRAAFAALLQDKGA